MRMILVMIAVALSLTATAQKKKKTVTHCVVTTYHPVKAQTDDTPLITSDGSRIDLRKLKRRANTLKEAENYVKGVLDCLGYKLNF